MNSSEDTQNGMLLRERILSAASAIGVPLTEAEAERLDRFAVLLRDANRKMNLTAITDDEGIAIRHFADSLSVYPILERERQAAGDRIFRALDLGTGAGFPGIPLCIVAEQKEAPPMHMLLMDAQAKRIRFLDSVIDDLKLEGVSTRHARAEDAARDRKAGLRESFDLVSARAVARLPVLLEYLLPFVRTGGLAVAMKGPDVQKEAAESGRALNVLGGRIEEISELVLPGDQRRSLVLIRKTKPCSNQYPRPAGKPDKAPIL